MRDALHRRRPGRALPAALLLVGLIGLVGLPGPAAEAAATVPRPGDPALDRTLTSGVTIGPHCAVTGFDGVLANRKGTECRPAGLSAGPAGLTLTSSAGQLANGDQQDALYERFDASRGGFVVHARLTGPVTQLTHNYQQIVLWFGPDTTRAVKVEAEHGNGTGPDPHLTMYWIEDGKAGPLGIVSLPALTRTKTLDLFIRADASHRITTSYSLDGGTTKTRVGPARTPRDVAAWFSATDAKAGILDSNSGSTIPVRATFTRFQISAG